MSERHPDITIEAQDFSPGFLDTPEPDTLVPGATPNAKNAIFSKVEVQDQTRATMRRREGSRLLNPTAMGTAVPVDFLWNFERENGTSELIAMCNGALYVWDGASTMDAIVDGSGFSALAPDVFAFTYRNELHVTDGSVMKRYNGTACFAVGFVAPTGAPTLTVGPATGVTGTYEGYAVWVDSATGHESSPSATTSAVAFTDDQRTWAKPAGAPPANVTHWRIYCRRTDTNENNFYRTGVDQLVATASYTEATSDTARRESAGPRVRSNDVPPAFALMEEYKGHRFGVRSNSSDLYISKQGDAESQHPSDVFPVGGRGDSKPVRQIRKFGEDVFIRKPTKSYIAVGERVPFKIDPIEGSWGAVSQLSGQEIDGFWYDWDERRGPYVSDMTSTWESLVDGRVRTVVDSVNRLSLHKIRSAHFETLSLVLWLVPTSGTRCRTILAYDYLRRRWLPPITGFEYVTMTTFTTGAGAYGLYFGDQWGRVYELFSGEVDGPPSGTTSAPITAAAGGSITASGAAFYVTGSGLAGMPVAVLSPAGQWQWVRAQSNTSTQITLDTLNGPALDPVPSGEGWTVVVGPIEWYWDTPRLTGGNRRMGKRLWSIWVEGSSTSSEHELEVLVRYNRQLGFTDMYEVSFPSGGLVWGVGSWGVDSWGAGGTRAMRKKRINRPFFDAQIRFQNFYPGQPFEITSYVMTADWVSGRRVPSVAG